MDARIGPTRFPVVQVGLGFLEAFEAEALQRRSLRMADARLDLPLSIWMPDATRQRDDAVMLEHIPVQGVERGIVNVGREYAFPQIIEHDHVSTSAQTAKSLLMQFGPDLRTGTKYQQAN